MLQGLSQTERQLDKMKDRFSPTKIIKYDIKKHYEIYTERHGTKDYYNTFKCSQKTFDLRFPAIKRNCVYR